MTGNPRNDDPHLPHSLRIRLVSPHDRPRHHDVDGYWWPRSADTCTELTALVPALDTQYDEVAKLLLSSAGWAPRPTTLTLRHRTIPLVWLGLYRNLLIAHCVERRPISLMVIPPHTPEPVAATAVAMAFGPAHHTPPSGILAQAAR
jgi:hypothetical protein